MAENGIQTVADQIDGRKAEMGGMFHVCTGNQKPKEKKEKKEKDKKEAG